MQTNEEQVLPQPEPYRDQGVAQAGATLHCRGPGCKGEKIILLCARTHDPRLSQPQRGFAAAPGDFHLANRPLRVYRYSKIGNSWPVVWGV